MKPPPIPDDDSRRVQELHDYGLLDGPHKEAIDGLVRVARRVCGTQTALVSLIDADRQWFLSRDGLDAEQTPRSVSFCGHAIVDDGLFEIPDARADARFADNPLVTGEPHIRFYAGIPLVNAHGHSLGTLCVLDPETRALDAVQRETLADLGQAVMALMEAHRQEKESEALVERLLAAEKLAARGRVFENMGRQLGGLLVEVQSALGSEPQKSNARLKQRGLDATGRIRRAIDRLQVDTGPVISRRLEPPASPRPRPSPSRPASPRPVRTGPSARVVAIDDDPSVLRVVRRALGTRHTVDVYQRPHDALTWLLEPDTPVDLILCDIVMPDMTGPQLYRAVIEERPELAERFVFLSGGAPDPEDEAFVDRLDNPWLHKPVSLEVLRAVVARAARRRG